MMSEVLLHIGMEKTGSSSIQHSLQGFDDGYSRYADFGNQHVNHSLPMQLLFKQALFDDKARLPRGLQSKGVDSQSMRALHDKFRACLRRELAANPGRLIFSAESFLTLKIDEVAVLRETVIEQAADVRIFAYVRDPIGYASSSFQQGLKAGTSAFRVPQPHYRRKIEKYLNTFGRDSLHLRAFATERLHRESVVADFGQWIDVELPYDREKRVNESLSVHAVALLYFWNMHGCKSTGAPELFSARMQMIRLLAHSLPGKFRLPQGLIEESLDRADIAWMEQLAGISLLGSGNDGEEEDDIPIRTAQDLWHKLGEASKILKSSTLQMQAKARQLGVSLSWESPIAAMDSLFKVFLAETAARSR